MFSSRYLVLLAASIAIVVATFSISIGTEYSIGKSGGAATGLITSVPRTMTYQGILKDSAGDPIPDGIYTVAFKIFNVETGGDSLWYEALPCTTSVGYFDVIFSNVVLPFDEDYWLELEINGEVLDPRRKINMSAYSARSDSSDYAEVSDMAINAATANFSDSTDAITDGAVDFTDIGQNGADSNQIMKWNGSAWALGYDEGESTHWNWSDSSSHGPDSVLFADVSVYANNAAASDFSDSTDAITDGAVDFSDIGQNGADINQVMKWNGSSWMAGDESVGGDSKWSVNDSVLYTTQYWGLARGGAGNIISGDSAHTTVNLGVASSLNGPYYSAITGGYGNSIESNFSSIAGGDSNHITLDGNYSFIGGGESNQITGGASSNHSFIGGGESNRVIGGAVRSNQVGYSIIVGGLGNTIDMGPQSFIGGGEDNYISIDGGHAVIGGGFNNHISGGLDNSNTIGGGRGNTAQGNSNTIAGGESNLIRNSDNCTIGGGSGNIAGYNNTGHGSTVGGGITNLAALEYSTVCGGYINSANSQSTVICGGEGNTADGPYSVIGGGKNNLAAGDYSAILGGIGDTINAEADYSYLFGINSNLTEDSTFMVDMPHIHFGDEATGYELPSSDGADGQVMATDGSGQLNWINSPNGPNWTVTDSVLFTNNYWGIARGGAGNTITGDSAHTNVNLGVESYVDHKYSSVTGGFSNTITGDYSAIVGGDSNQALSYYAFIGGGRSNRIHPDPGWYAAIVGGFNNDSNGGFSFIGGGENNYIADDGGHAVIGGGQNNHIAGGVGNTNHNTIGGGSDNQIGGISTVAATISGGSNNIIEFHSWSSTISGGEYNSIGGVGIESNYATIGGGSYNTVYEDFSLVGGGAQNSIEGKYSTISGGYADTIDAGADYSYLFGIGSKLAEDSTFMVDMPHIHFGDEATGYEFPDSDGALGQVMATDGSGQLNWVDVTAMVRGEMQKMKNTIDDLKRQNEELSGRIRELEAKIK